MNTLDDRARRAAEAVRRVADTVDPEEVLARIEQRGRRPAWLVPAVTVVAAALLVLVGSTLARDEAPVVRQLPEVITNPEPSPTTTCRAGDLPGRPTEQPGLPPAVADVRARIAAAAVTCDHARLAELALSGPGGFTASFGGVDDLQAWFAEQDLRTLRRLLDLPYGVQEPEEGPAVYAWPSAFVQSSDEAWQALYDAGLATPEDRASMEAAFGAWVGFRHGITADGDWIFYVAGD